MLKSVANLEEICGTSWSRGLQIPRGFGGAASARFRVSPPHCLQAAGGVLLPQLNLTTKGGGMATNGRLIYQDLATESSQRPHILGRG